MKLDFAFKRIDTSQALMQYAEGRVDRLHKWELKPNHGHMTFSMQRHVCKAELTLVGQDTRFHASAEGTDLYEAVDEVIEKIGHQMMKTKEKMQHHKRPEFSNEYALEHLTKEDLTPDYSPLRGSKKAG